MDDLQPIPGLTKYWLLSRVRRLHTNKSGARGKDWYWLWVCDCGGTRVAKLQKVMDGRVRCCVGCPIGCPTAAERVPSPRKCVQCGAGFLSLSAKAKYCSPVCRRAAHRPEPKDRPAENRTCPNCGRVFEVKPGRRGPGRTTCSQNCTSSRPRRLPKAKACERCGKEFTSGPTPGRPRRYCSQECTTRACSERLVAGKLCPDCGRPIKTVKGERCKSCAHRIKQAKLAESVRWCVECHDFYRPRVVNQRFCSKACTKQHHWQNRQNLMRASGDGEDVYRGDVYRRDAGICQLCGDPVDLSVRWPAPLSASIDHIVPVSKGGLHTFANCQLAHLGCNSRKSNRTEQECPATA